MIEIQNIPYDRLKVGMSAEARRLCVPDDILAFAHASGHLIQTSADSQTDTGALPPPALWLGALIASLLHDKLPGPGMEYLSQSLQFAAGAKTGDELIVRVELTAKDTDQRARFDTSVTLGDGTKLAWGEALVKPAASAISVDQAQVPGLIVKRHVHFNKMLKDAEASSAMPTAVVAPEEPNSLAGAVLAAEHRLITPVLVGDPDLIAAAADEIGADISAFAVEPAASHSDAASKAVAMVHSGRVHALMKGHLHTDVLLSAVVHRDTGLRTAKRLSHVFLLDVPGLPHPLAVTDAAINISPDLDAKVDILQNAIDLLRALGKETPLAAVLSAVETINPKIQSSVDAAILSKMAERGQIRGGIVDGPLAMDNAISSEAAKIKGIKSLVAGHPDILLAPNLDAGNLVAKELIYVAQADAAGLVLGARCPIILTSRADDDKARLASCAAAALYVKGTQDAGGIVI